MSRSVKITKAAQAELERGWRERNVRLREIGLAKETFEQYKIWVYGKGKKYKPVYEKVSVNATVFPTNPTGEKNRQIVEQGRPFNDHDRFSISRGPVSSKPSPTYTGTKILGIGTMHKSNAVPIFSDEEAKDISSMRR